MGSLLWQLYHPGRRIKPQQRRPINRYLSNEPPLQEREAWLDQFKLQLATDWTVALARARAEFPQHAAGVLHHTIGPAPSREKSDGLIAASPGVDAAAVAPEYERLRQQGAARVLEMDGEGRLCQRPDAAPPECGLSVHSLTRSSTTASPPRSRCASAQSCAPSTSASWRRSRRPSAASTRPRPTTCSWPLPTRCATRPPARALLRARPNAQGGGGARPPALELRHGRLRLGPPSAVAPSPLWHSGTLATPLSPRVGSTRRTITMVKPRRRAVKCCKWFVNNPPFYKVYSTDALLYPPRHTLLHHGPPRARHAAPLHRRRHLGRGSLCGWPGWPCSGLARAFRSAGSAAALWSPTGHFSGGAHTHT